MTADASGVEYDNLVMYTLYNSPIDAVGEFVIRRFIINRTGLTATDDVWKAITQKGVVDAVGDRLIGYHFVPRDPKDHESVVGSWL